MPSKRNKLLVLLGLLTVAVSKSHNQRFEHAFESYRTSSASNLSANSRQINPKTENVRPSTINHNSYLSYYNLENDRNQEIKNTLRRRILEDDSDERVEEKKPITQYRQMQFNRRAGILEDDSDIKTEEKKPTIQSKQMQFSRRAGLVHQDSTSESSTEIDPEKFYFESQKVKDEKTTDNSGGIILSRRSGIAVTEKSDTAPKNDMKAEANNNTPVKDIKDKQSSAKDLQNSSDGRNSTKTSNKKRKKVLRVRVRGQKSNKTISRDAKDTFKPIEKTKLITVTTTQKPKQATEIKISDAKTATAAKQEDSKPKLKFPKFTLQAETFQSNKSSYPEKKALPDHKPPLVKQKPTFAELKQSKEHKPTLTEQKSLKDSKSAYTEQKPLKEHKLTFTKQKSTFTELKQLKEHKPALLNQKSILTEQKQLNEHKTTLTQQKTTLNEQNPLTTKAPEVKQFMTFYRRSGPKQHVTVGEQDQYSHADWPSTHKSENQNEDENYYLLSFNYKRNKDGKFEDSLRLPQTATHQDNGPHKSPQREIVEYPTGELNIGHLEKYADKILEKQKNIAKSNTFHHNHDGYYHTKSDIFPINHNNENHAKEVDSLDGLSITDKSFLEKQHSPIVTLKRKQTKKQKEPVWQLQPLEAKFPNNEQKSIKSTANHQDAEIFKLPVVREVRPKKGVDETNYYARSFIKLPSGDKVNIDFKPVTQGNFKEINVKRKPFPPLENKGDGNYFIHMYKKVGNIENFQVKTGKIPEHLGYLSSLKLSWTDDDRRARVDEAVDSRSFMPYSTEIFTSAEDNKESIISQPSELLMQYKPHYIDDFISPLNGDQFHSFYGVPVLQRRKRSTAVIPQITTHFTMGNSKIENNYTLKYKPKPRHFSKRMGLIVNDPTALVQQQAEPIPTQPRNIDDQQNKTINNEKQMKIPYRYSKPTESRGIKENKSVYNTTYIFNKYEKPSRGTTNIQIFRSYQTPNRNPKQAHNMTYFLKGKNAKLNAQKTDRVRTRRMHNPQLRSNRERNVPILNNFTTSENVGFQSTNVKEYYIKPEKETNTNMSNQTNSNVNLFQKNVTSEQNDKRNSSVTNRTNKITLKSKDTTFEDIASTTAIPTTYKADNTLPKINAELKKITNASANQTDAKTGTQTISEITSNSTAALPKTKKISKTSKNRSNRKKVSSRRKINKDSQKVFHAQKRMENETSTILEETNTATSKPTKVKSQKTTKAPTASTIPYGQKTDKIKTKTNHTTTPQTTSDNHARRMDENSSSQTEYYALKRTTNPVSTTYKIHTTTTMRPVQKATDIKTKTEQHGTLAASNIKARRIDEKPDILLKVDRSVTKPTTKTSVKKTPTATRKAKLIQKKGDFRTDIENLARASNTQSRQSDDNTWYHPQKYADYDNQDHQEIVHHSDEHAYGNNPNDNHQEGQLHTDNDYQDNSVGVTPKIKWQAPPSSHHWSEKGHPTYHAIPKTHFSCKGRAPGYYADLEAECQVFHVCHGDGVKHSFLCPNGTIFNQRLLVCDWHSKVLCETAETFYGVNNQLYKYSEQEERNYKSQERNNWIPNKNQNTAKYTIALNGKSSNKPIQINSHSNNNKGEDVPLFIVKHFKENIPNAEIGKPRSVSKSYSAVIAKQNDDTSSSVNDQTSHHNFNNYGNIQTYNHPPKSEILIQNSFTDDQKALKNSWNTKEVEKKLKHELSAIPEQSYSYQEEPPHNQQYRHEAHSKTNSAPVTNSQNSYYVPNVNQNYNDDDEDNVHVAGRHNDQVVIINRNRLNPDFGSSESQESTEPGSPAFYNSQPNYQHQVKTTTMTKSPYSDKVILQKNRSPHIQKIPTNQNQKPPTFYDSQSKYLHKVTTTKATQPPYNDKHFLKKDRSPLIQKFPENQNNEPQTFHDIQPKYLHDVKTTATQTPYIDKNIIQKDRSPLIQKTPTNQSQGHAEVRVPQYIYPLPGIVQNSDGSTKFNYGYRVENPETVKLEKTHVFKLSPLSSKDDLESDFLSNTDNEGKRKPLEEGIKLRLQEIKSSVDSIGSKVGKILDGSDNTFKNVRIFKLKPDGTSGELEEIRLTPFKFQKQSEPRNSKLEEERREKLEIKVIRDPPRNHEINQQNFISNSKQNPTNNGIKTTEFNSNSQINADENTRPSSRHANRNTVISTPKQPHKVTQNVPLNYKLSSTDTPSTVDNLKNIRQLSAYEQMIKIVPNTNVHLISNQDVNKESNLGSFHGNINENPHTGTVNIENRLNNQNTQIILPSKSMLTNNPDKKYEIKYIPLIKIDGVPKPRTFDLQDTTPQPQYKDEKSEQFENIYIPKNLYGKDPSDFIYPDKIILQGPKDSFIKAKQANLANQKLLNSNYKNSMYHFDNTYKHEPVSTGNVNENLFNSKTSTIHNSNPYLIHTTNASQKDINDQSPLTAISKTPENGVYPNDNPTSNKSNYQYYNINTPQNPVLIQNTNQQLASDSHDSDSLNSNSNLRLELGKNGPNHHSVQFDRAKIISNADKTYHNLPNENGIKCLGTGDNNKENQNENFATEEPFSQTLGPYKNPVSKIIFKELKRPKYAYAPEKTSPKTADESVQLTSKPVKLFQLQRNTRPAFVKPITAIPIIPASAEGRSNFHPSGIIKEVRPISHYPGQNRTPVGYYHGRQEMRPVSHNQRQPVYHHSQERRELRPTIPTHGRKIVRPIPSQVQSSRSLTSAPKTRANIPKSKYAELEKAAEMKAMLKLNEQKAKINSHPPARTRPQGEILSRERPEEPVVVTSSNNSKNSKYSALEREAELKAERMLRSKKQKMQA